MTANDARCRVPAGVKEGGQFAPGARRETTVELPAPPKDRADEFGFPTVDCGRCKGTGKSLYNKDLNHSRCFVCGGTGRSYERGLVADTVRAFARAQMEASRPRVRQLRKGDVVSEVYHDVGKAKWAKVVSVLVYPSRPVKWEGKGESRRPVEFEATIQLSDGTALRTSTSTVVARRGAQIDPTPFLQVLAQQGQAHRRRPVLTAKA